MLKDGGVLVVVTIQQEKKTDWVGLMDRSKYLTLIYKTHEEGYNVVIGVKQSPKFENSEGTTIAQLDDNLTKNKNILGFEEECAKSLELVYPVQGQKFKESEWEVAINVPAKPKKKKKKK